MLSPSSSSFLSRLSMCILSFQDISCSCSVTGSFLFLHVKISKCARATLSCQEVEKRFDFLWGKIVIKKKSTFSKISLLLVQFFRRDYIMSVRILKNEFYVDSTISMALFRNVENAKEVRQNVMNGTFEAALLKPSMVWSPNPTRFIW